MSDYPIQVEKVQAPPLRDDILTRDRLLDWLNVKIHSRVVLLTAEAGYGKTTLLADFARRTRLRVLWYRLDRGDRDWVGFIAYLVAAVRVHLPDFGPATSSLLRETGSSAPPLESVLDTFLRELGDLASEPTALIFDDFHLVDDSEDIREVMRALVARAPERMAVVLASRRPPPLRLARLRALGELAELRTDELRFDQAETTRLFNETFSLRIEAGLLTELSRRTEGWAASLQLVRAAIHDRDARAVRSFIHSLSGAKGDLYDYLAEEVIADLPSGLQEFLMRTSILETVDLALGPVAASVSEARARALIDEAERRGLLGRQRAETRHIARAHPLVREFLQSRLEKTIGRPAIRDLHRRVGAAAETADWRLASTHYLAAERPTEAARVLLDSIEVVLATGAYGSADAIARQLPDHGPSALREIIKSRVSLKAGDSSAAEEHARRAVAIEPESDVAIWNALMISLSCGAFQDLEGYAERLRTLRSTPFRQISAKAVVATVDSSVDGQIGAAESLMMQSGAAALRAGHTHFLGVSLLNQAQLRRAAGNASAVLELAENAIAALAMTSSGIELVSARLTRAWALAHLGRLEESRAEVAEARQTAVRPLEFAFEAADIEVFYGSIARAEAIMAPYSEMPDATDVGEQALLTLVSIDVVRGRLEEAEDGLRRVAWGRRSTTPGAESKRRALRAYVAHISGQSNSGALAEDAVNHARSQGADLWSRFVTAFRTESPSRASIEPVYYSMAAEAIAHLIGQEPALASALRGEARLRPERWRPALRRALDSDVTSDALAAGVLLDEVGESADVPRLRITARRLRLGANAALGRGLSRRLAPTALIQDLGHVEIRIGDRIIPGTDVRRKVLALLTLLITKPGFRAHREEVLEALWPDLEPASALNSLNQTTYFLRRIFEPDYSDDLSPGYVGQTTEFIWLDRDLVRAQSAFAEESIRAAARDSDTERILDAVQSYTGRFALDFIYEDWAAPYRDRLHAAFLHLVEVSLHSDIDTGQFRRGIRIAQAASIIEPEGDQIQSSLVRLYRLAGAHAAAAEQFARYSAFLRELGVEPPPMEDL